HIGVVGQHSRGGDGQGGVLGQGVTVGRADRGGVHRDDVDADDEGGFAAVAVGNPDGEEVGHLLPIGPDAGEVGIGRVNEFAAAVQDELVGGERSRHTGKG